MKVTQIHTLLNTVTQEVLGESDLVLEDLSNVVDIGKKVMSIDAMDGYVKSLVNQIAKIIFVSRKYEGSAPSVLMDSWEYGAVVEKIQMEMPDVEENATWSLTDKQTYNQDIFYQPKVSAKFFNSKTTFEIPISFTELQVKQSFQSAQQLNSFVSMIYSAIDQKMTVCLDELIMRTINAFTAATIKEEYKAEALNSKSTQKAVNLLFLYNAMNGGALRPEEAVKDPGFLRFAVATMQIYTERMKKISRSFNIGKKARFTPADKMHVVMLADFKKNAEVYLYNGLNQFKTDHLGLPEADSVPYWQGPGLDYSFGSISKINVKTQTDAGKVETVEAGGILAVAFDREALGVTNLDRRTTTHYNAKAEFYNSFFKQDAGFFNDFDENFVVFFVA